MECFVFNQSDKITNFDIRQVRSKYPNCKIILINDSTLFKLKIDFDTIIVNNLQNLLIFSNITVKWNKGIIVDYFSIKQQLVEKDITIKNRVDKIVRRYNCYLLDSSIKSLSNSLSSYFKKHISLFSWNNKDQVFKQIDDQLIGLDFSTPNPIIHVKPPISPVKKEKDKRILIIGNDPYLNDFSEKLKTFKIPNDVVTIGINRSFMKIKTQYLAFLDIEIIDEILTFIKFSNNEWIRDIIPIYNEGFLERRKYVFDEQRKNPNKPDPPTHWNINKQFDILVNKFKQTWPNAINSQISYFVIPTILSTMYYCVNYLFKEYNCKFFITASSFQIKGSNHHFWNSQDIGKDFLQCAKPDIYQNRLNHFVNSIRGAIKREKLDVTSIQENSRLNDFTKIINIDNFLERI